MASWLGAFVICVAAGGIGVAWTALVLFPMVIRLEDPAHPNCFVDP
jgi:hypothetical protein